MRSTVRELSKVVSHALRHEPWLYELELDAAGWVPIGQLLDALRQEREEWQTICEEDLADMIRNSSKKRHEIREGRIRAKYGHSTPNRVALKPALPPHLLYHGTSPELLQPILESGLLPMRRHYVHLSTDQETALEVGRRKADRPVILEVKAAEAVKASVTFYKGNEKVWLADAIPPDFVVVLSAY